MFEELDVNDWYTIPTPFLQSILDFQFKNEDEYDDWFSSDTVRQHAEERSGEDARRRQQSDVETDPEGAKFQLVRKIQGNDPK